MKELERALTQLQATQDILVEQEPSDKSRQLLQLTASILSISQLVFGLIQAIDGMKNGKKDSSKKKPTKSKAVKAPT
jgi:Mg2+ and Co2+ transporter CorA